MSEELNALIAQAESGDVPAMNQLTHIYGEEEGYINHVQAAKWFLELIKRDCDPNSGVYENTGYNKGLYEKIKNAILNSATEDDMLSSLSGGPAGGSLLGGAMYFTTSNAKSYINQAEKAIQRNIAYKEEQRRKAEECARREREERERREREEKERQEREKRAEEERAARERREREERERREREEKERQERERREQEEKEKRIQAFCIKVSKDYDDQSGFNLPCKWFSEEMEIIMDENVGWNEIRRIGAGSINKKEYKKTLIIPEGVTHIGNNVFWQHYNSFHSIELPRTLTSIGKRAFGQTSLRFDLIIPSNVTSIGEGAFRDCGLTSVIIPDSVTSIENETFAGCGCLTSVTIGNSVTSIGEFAFQGCSSLTSITIPNSVTSIGKIAFYCSGLTSVTIPNSVTRIGIGAFADCSSLKRIIVPKGTKQHFLQMEGIKGLESLIVEE